MTMRNARRLLVLVLGVAGVALVAGASGASAVELQCRVGYTWGFSPPLDPSRPQTVTVRYTEYLYNCTGNSAAVTGPTGSATGSFTSPGATCLVLPVPPGTKTFTWPLLGFVSTFSYPTGVTTVPAGQTVDYVGTITAGIPPGNPVATEHLTIAGGASTWYNVCGSGQAPGISGSGTFTIN